MMVVLPAVWPLLRVARSRAPMRNRDVRYRLRAQAQLVQRARRPLQRPPLQAEGRSASSRLLRVGAEEEAAVGARRRLQHLRRRCDSGLCNRPGCSLGPGRLGRSVGPGRLCCSDWPGRLFRSPDRPIYGAGQHTYQPAKPAATVASVPAEMTPAIAGDEAPPAPEVKETSGLLLPTPSGN